MRIHIVSGVKIGHQNYIKYWLITVILEKLKCTTSILRTILRSTCSKYVYWISQNTFTNNKMDQTKHFLRNIYWISQNTFTNNKMDKTKHLLTYDQRCWTKPNVNNKEICLRWYEHSSLVEDRPRASKLEKLPFAREDDESDFCIA